MQKTIGICPISDVRFQVAIADTTFVGYLDLVRKAGDEIQVVSFSTGSQAPPSVFLEKDFIMSLYAHAIWQGTLYPRYPDLSDEIRLETIPALGVYHFPHLERYQKKNGTHQKGERKGDPMILVSRSKEQLLEFEYEILSLVSGIEQGFFPMMPRFPMGCSVCRYAHGCTETVDTSFDIEEFAKKEDAA